jgi:spore coat protein U-like protein
MGDKATFPRAIATFAALALASAALVCAGSAGAAGRKTATVNVRLKVQSACTLQTNTLYFGVPLNGQKSIDGTTTIVATCTPGLAYRLGIDNGQYFDGTSRRMWGGQANGQVWYAVYRLYRDAARTQLWGNTAADSKTGTIPLTGFQTFTVYGTADLKNVRSAGYADTVTVVIEY